MTNRALRVLFASRAFESAHIEGGFLLLRDIAARSGDDAALDGAFLSTQQVGARTADGGVELLPAFSRGGWGIRSAMEFARAVSRQAPAFDIVHTAHVPTSINARVLSRIRRKARAQGTKFVQTVTALPARHRLSPRLLWADAVVCLNDELAATASTLHDNVTVIPPMPSPTRLANRPAIPAELATQLDGRKVVSIAVDLVRLAADFDLEAVCRSLLHSRDDVAVVVACRFGEDEYAMRELAALLEAWPERMFVLGEIDYMLSLLAASSVLLYPVGNMQKKFNPPLVVLEALNLGARVVASESVNCAGLADGDTCRIVSSVATDDWLQAVTKQIQSGRTETGSLVSFDDVYLQYTSLYQALDHRHA